MRRATLARLSLAATRGHLEQAEGIPDAAELVACLRGPGYKVGPCGLPAKLTIDPEECSLTLRPRAPAGHVHSVNTRQV